MQLLTKVSVSVQLFWTDMKHNYSLWLLEIDGKKKKKMKSIHICHEYEWTAKCITERKLQKIELWMRADLIEKPSLSVYNHSKVAYPCKKSVLDLF